MFSERSLRHFGKDLYNTNKNRSPMNTNYFYFNCGGYALGTISWYLPSETQEVWGCWEEWDEQTVRDTTAMAVSYMLADFSDLRVISYLCEVRHDEYAIEGAWEMPNHAWSREVFVEDVRAIHECDVILILNWGMYSDSGTAWEAGYAYGNKIPTVQVLCGEPNTTYSLMMINGADKVIHLADVENWEEKSAEADLSKIIQK